MSVNYGSHVSVVRSGVFSRWLRGLRDSGAKARIQVRIARLIIGNPGDVKPVGGGVFELRIDYGPGYRVYFAYRAEQVVLLLCGGDKSTQHRDIERAHRLKKELEA